MKVFLTTLLWDLRLLQRHHIVTVTTAITALYVLLFYLLPEFSFRDEVLIMLIFSDPAMLGFMFIGAIVLFEKSANTLPALVVTPIRPWQYIWAKTSALTLLALSASLVMALAGHGWGFQAIWLILAVVFSSFIFLLAGFIGVARVRTLNQYLVLVPLFFLPLLLPLLNFFGVTDSLWLYLIPTQGLLILFEAAFNPVPETALLYAILYPLASVALLFVFARRTFVQHIIATS